MTEHEDFVHGMNDDELANYLRMMQGANDKLREQLAQHDAKIKTAMREQEARTLAAYWKAHPTLLKLDVGDKVMITDEYQAYYWRTARQPPLTKIGDINRIGGFRMRGDEIDTIWMEGRGGRTPYDLMVRMRQAYLQSVADGSE